MRQRRGGRAPVTVLAAAGIGGARTRHVLRASPTVALVRSPRQASVLVVAGQVTEPARAPLLQVHDQLPRPRGVVAVATRGLPTELDQARHVGEDDLVAAVLAAGDDVLAGRLDSEDVLPGRNPVEWRGVGPHGQGGEGMMGGMPYGRSMPMTADGRDGLALDRLPLTLGPWLPGLPAGCRIDAGLQGDVLEEAAVTYPDAGPTLDGTVAVAEVELLRARTLLGWFADLVALAGLDAEAVRASRLALDPSGEGIAAVRRRLDRVWSLRAATDGVGELTADQATGRGVGWLARSRGVDEDRRRDDPAYHGLDLPVPHDRGGDVTARWRTWLDEAAAALDLAAQAGERTTDRPELPWGGAGVGVAERAAALGELASQVLTGQEIGRGLLTLASLPGAADADVAARPAEVDA